MNLIYGVHGLGSPPGPDTAQQALTRMGQAALASVFSPSGLCRFDKRVPGGPAWGRVGAAEEAASLPTAGESQGAPYPILAQCRLDNRGDLLNRFAWPDDAAHPDAALVVEAYARYGMDCVAHLRGDWAFALWDASQQRLLLARDATGNSALFWWQGGGLLYFASTLPTLLASGAVPARSDPRWLAGLLTVFSDPAHPTATALEGVHGLPPGHLLDIRGHAATVHRWWHPETLPALDGTPLPVLEDQFLALYDDAVRQRLRHSHGSVAATLSGGLDSGSVVALAAPALAARGQRLTAYVHVPGFEVSGDSTGRTTNEWPLALATARHVGGVDPVACPSLHITPLGAMRRWLDIAGRPSHAASNWYWILDILQQAQGAGASVLLTGQGGNGTVSFAGSGDLRPQLAALQFGQVARALWQEDAGLRSALERRLIKPALRPAWHHLRRAKARSRQPMPWQGYALLNPALSEELNLPAAMASAGHDPSYVSVSAQKLTLWRLGLQRWADGTGFNWAQVSMHFQMEVRDPTRDQRLVEFCARLPDALAWANGKQRGLIRHTMRKYLPTEVLFNTRKGLQSADLRARLRADKEALLAEVDAVSQHGAVRAWLDVPRLQRSALAAVADGPPAAGDHVSPMHMLRALMAAMFIARHS